MSYVVEIVPLEAGRRYQLCQPGPRHYSLSPGTHSGSDRGLREIEPGRRSNLKNNSSDIHLIFIFIS